MTEYSHDRYAYLIQFVKDEMDKLGKLKGGEYAGDNDRLANFRRNAASIGLPMESIWAVYCAKHWDAIMQYVKDENNGVKRERLEGLEGRAMDIIVYMTLFIAMLDEKQRLPQITHFEMMPHLRPYPVPSEIPLNSMV